MALLVISFPQEGPTELTLTELTFAPVSRDKASLTSWRTRFGWFQPRLSAGFAELQVGEDSSGFDFGGSGPTGVETAGPEAGASIRALLPISSGFEFVGELGFSAAYFSAAPQLIKPQARFQPSASLTFGVGF